MTDAEYGYIKIKLGNILKERNISKNKFCHKAEMQRSQLNAYCNGTITRLDTAVLAKICAVLECEIQDIIEFVPADKKE